MKLYLHCHECYTEFFENLTRSNPGTQEASDAGFSALTAYEAEVLDNSTYQVECYKHGRYDVIIYTQKFEILFQISLNAVLDGYYREAVGSFSSSLERFHEYYLRIIATNTGIDSLQFDEAWKKIDNQSERQLGAYIIEYFFKNGETPPLLTQKQTEFRNKVIHKGKIPTREEAMIFGNSAISVMRPVLSNLRKTYGDAVTTVDDNRLRDLMSEISDRSPTILKQSVHLIFGASYKSDILMKQSKKSFKS